MGSLFGWLKGREVGGTGQEVGKRLGKKIGLALWRMSLISRAINYDLGRKMGRGWLGADKEKRVETRH